MRAESATSAERKKNALRSRIRHVACVEAALCLVRCVKTKHFFETPFFKQRQR